jgi:GalNAc-alpha-(1->4)-GalNAc-alpha-(1->3)-diNAcBac-PP-undecaprenol alpha-1,4-N-acetyl-D-galactosaminyltransferase
MQKKTIAFYYSNFGTGGAERVMTLLANYFVQSYNVVLITQNITSIATVKLSSEIRLLRVDESKFTYQITEAIVHNKIDIFLLSDFWQHEELLVDILESKKVPFIFTEHNNFYYFYSFPTSEYVLKRLNLYSRANITTVLDNYNYQLYRFFLPNTLLLANPVYFNNSIVSMSRHKEKNIIAVGRMVEQKDFHKLLKVFSLIHLKHTDWNLLLIGSGHLLEELKIMARELCIQDNVIFTGNIDNVSDYYEKSAIHVMTSKFEGMPMTLLEAKQHTIPSIVMDIPCFQDLIEQGKDGFIVPQDDIEGMVEKIIFLIENPEEREKMGEFAQQSVQQYNIEIIGKRWENLFELVLNNDQHTINSVLAKDYAPKTSFDTQKIIADFVKEYNLLYERLCKHEEFTQYMSLEDKNAYLSKGFKLLKWFLKFKDSIKQEGYWLTIRKTMQFVWKKRKKIYR